MASSSAPDVGDLLAKILRHFGAVGFIGSERFRAKGGFGAFKNSRNVVGFEGGHQLPQHVVEDEDGLGGQTRGGAHGGRSGAGTGVISTEDEAEGIDEKKSRNWQSSIG